MRIHKFYIFDIFNTVISPPDKDVIHKTIDNMLANNVLKLTHVTKEWMSHGFTLSPLAQILDVKNEQLRDVLLVNNFKSLNHLADEFTFDSIEEKKCCLLFIEEFYNNMIPYYTIADGFLEFYRLHQSQIRFISNINSFDKNIFNKLIDTNKEYCFFSCDIGIKKPDTAIFEIAIKTLNLKAKDLSQIAYLGDSFKSDILPTKKLGLSTYLVKNNLSSILKERLYHA